MLDGLPRMPKFVLIIFGAMAIAVAVVVGLFLAPMILGGFRSVRHQRALQARSDYPQIAAACVSLARSITNDSALIWPSDPIVPATLRSLSPKYINAETNSITLEFHGGFDHYGFRVDQSDTDPKLWTIYYYTEQSQKLLTTITND